MQQSSSSQPIDKSPGGSVLFVVGLVMAIFFGGGVRTLLSPQQIQVFIQSELEERNPKFTLEFEKAQFTLAQGIWARLGLDLTNVVVKAKDPCITQVELAMDSAYFPINMFSLVQGKLKFNTIEFGNVRVSDGQGGCQKTNRDGRTPEPVVEVDSSKTKESTNLEKNPLPIEKKLSSFDVFYSQLSQFINSRWARELHGTRRWLDGVLIENLSVSGISEQNHGFEISRLNLEMNEAGENAELELWITPGPSMVYYQPLKNIFLKIAVGETELNVRGTSKYREGRVELDGKLALQSGDFNLQGKVKNIPAVDIFGGLSKKGIVPNLQGPRPIWLTCGQSLKGNLSQWKASHLDLQNCFLSGELGSIHLDKGKLFPFSDIKATKEFRLTLRQFSLKNLWEAFGREFPTGMVHQLGKMSGSLVAKSKDHVEFQGALSDMSIIFSINGRREFQKISKLSGRLLFKEGRLSGLIDAIDIEEGSFAGLLSFNFHESMREGLVQSKVEKLLFKPEVQKLLGFHPEKGTEVYGKGQWGPEFPFRWQGSIGLPRVNRGGLSFESVSYKTQWSDDEWNGQVTASRLEVDRKSSWHRVMTNIYLGEHDPDEKIQWKNIEANFRVTEQGFLWERSQAQDANQDIVFSSAGSHKGHQATGFIEVDFPALKQLKWNLAGDFQKPTLTPSPEMLTSLAKTRPDLQAPIAMEILWQGGELMGSPFGVPRALGTPPPKQEP